ncbi:MAG: hypothetical protein L0177_19845 [Chloroflexi bacterium]|nr:hypothetical protein [Chloroflexota bacterium]
MTLILAPCRVCPGQVLDLGVEPRCFQCGAPATPPSPDLTPEEGQVRETFHRLRWKVRLPRYRPGRNSIVLERFDVTIEYFVEESRHGSTPLARVMWVSGWPPAMSKGNDERLRYLRKLFERTTGFRLRGLADALAETEGWQR